ncbi:hypothetical protein Ate02nite_26850 [Paractinoplanes tereljensis]|uniref:Uncharacterized protein n=1 Tax=Paractinoplanes tereljensis TaxID=571912 RepID=A0A919TT26_9ACTN|nr:hypothetical protein Ate02nite_26850 [Actinoplanes tereljensis]
MRGFGPPVPVGVGRGAAGGGALRRSCGLAARSSRELRKIAAVAARTVAARTVAARTVAARTVAARTVAVRTVAVGGQLR